MLSHGKLDLSYFYFGGAEKCVDLLYISVAEIAEEIIMFLRVKLYICVEFGPMWTHKEVFSRLLELRTLMDSVW